MSLLRHPICVAFHLFLMTEIIPWNCNGTAGVHCFLFLHDFIIFFSIKGKCNTGDVSVSLEKPRPSIRLRESRTVKLSCKLPVNATFRPPVNREPSSEPYITASLPLWHLNAEREKAVLRLVLRPDCSHSQLNCWRIKDLLRSFHTTGRAKSCEGKHAGYAAPEPTRNLT